MEPKFRTSFIPKQTLTHKEEGAPKRRAQKSGGLQGAGRVIALVVLIVTIGGAAVIYFYERFLDNSINEKIASLERARDAFQPRLIEELNRLDTRIDSAEVLLSEHLAPSTLFSLVESITLKSVQFNQMTYDYVSGATVELSLSGQALNFDSVALQSDVLGNNRFIRQPVVSGLAVQGEERVSFEVTARIDPRFLLYETTLDEEAIRERLEADGQTLQ